MSQVAKSHLEIIVAVGENRQRHAAALAATDDPVERAVLEREHSDIINEAVDYRLAMLGLSDEALPENVRGVDRAALGDAYLVVYSSSTVWKSTNASGGPDNSSLRFGDDVAVLARSSGEELASPRHRAGVASMAWR